MLRYLAAMLIFGTIGLFVRSIELPSTVIVLCRGFIGSAFLFAAGALLGRKVNWTSVRANFARLASSGVLLGLNWVLLFEAYKSATIAAATLIYYLAPIFVMALSVVFLGERLTARKCLCAAAALFGMSLVAGFWSPNAAANSTMVGLLQALGAAGFYAALILNNKFIGRTVPVDPLDSALVQLFTAALVLVPYVAAVVDLSTIRPDALSLGLTLVVAVLHTAVAYWLFFSAIPKLEAARIAVFAYVDPATAILLSILLLKEPFTLASVGGALLILGAAAALEFGNGRKP